MTRERPAPRNQGLKSVNREIRLGGRREGYREKRGGLDGEGCDPAGCVRLLGMREMQ